MKEIRITPKPHYMGFGYDLRILDYTEKWYARDMTIQNVSGEDADSAIEIPPLLDLTKDELQKWMDELWTLGIRPSNGSGDGNAIEAIRYHLQDMRKLVFKDKA